MKNIVLSLALVLAVSAPAFAGEGKKCDKAAAQCPKAKAAAQAKAGTCDKTAKAGCDKSKAACSKSQAKADSKKVASLKGAEVLVQ